MIEDVKGTITNIENQQITKDGVFKFILDFGKVYNQLSKAEKKELALRLIERIEIFPEEKEDGPIIKSVTFRFPINFCGKRISALAYDGQTSDNHVECVVMMSKDK